MAKQMDLKALLESKMGSITPVEDAKTAIERVETIVPKNLMFDSDNSIFSSFSIGIPYLLPHFTLFFIKNQENHLSKVKYCGGITPSLTIIR